MKQKSIFNLALMEQVFEDNINMMAEALTSEIMTQLSENLNEFENDGSIDIKVDYYSLVELTKDLDENDDFEEDIMYYVETEYIMSRVYQKLDIKDEILGLLADSADGEIQMTGYAYKNVLTINIVDNTESED